jgi:hypothetical protein
VIREHSADIPGSRHSIPFGYMVGRMNSPTRGFLTSFRVQFHNQGYLTGFRVQVPRTHLDHRLTCGYAIGWDFAWVM